MVFQLEDVLIIFILCCIVITNLSLIYYILQNELCELSFSELKLLEGGKPSSIVSTVDLLR